MKETPFSKVSEDGEFKGFPDDNNYSEYLYQDMQYNTAPLENVVWDTEDSIIDAIDWGLLDLDAIDAKIEELSSDWQLDFIEFQKYLENTFSEEVWREVEEYVYRHYPRLFTNDDEFWWTERMPKHYKEECEIAPNNKKHPNRGYKQRKPSYNELDDYSLAA